MAEAESRLRNVEARIAGAAEQAGRSPAEVTLVAVSKTFDAAAIEPVIAAGHRDFGENRVQEAQGKWPRLRLETPDLRLHLIGPLQTNKVAMRWRSSTRSTRSIATSLPPSSPRK